MQDTTTPTPLIIGFDGTELDKDLESFLREINPVGIILFRRNILSPLQTQNLIQDIQRLLGNIIISIDHEGGMVNRFPAEFPSIPSAAALGKTNSRKLLDDAAHIQAETLRYFGFNLNFAPVADLATNSENPVIATRSFGNDPDQVSSFIETLVRFHQDHGIGATIKHFPGHGESTFDTHFTAGSISTPLELLRKRELIPFIRGIQSGVAATMIAHLRYLELDPHNIATFSHRIITELLRNELQFNGLVVTDCIEMEGTGKDLSPEEISYKALQAGADCVISSYSLKKSRDFQRRLKDGIELYKEESEITRKDFHSKLQRINSFLQHFPAKTILQAKPSEEKARELALRCIDFNKWTSLPVSWQKYLLVEIMDTAKSGILEGEAVTHVGKVLSTCKNIHYFRSLHLSEFDYLIPVIDKANQAGQTVLLITVNAYRMNGFSNLSSLLEKATHSIHIALASDKDCSGSTENEWITRGFNAYTAFALYDLFSSTEYLSSAQPPVR